MNDSVSFYCALFTGSTKGYERLKAEMGPLLELFLGLLCSLASYPEGEYIMRL